ncbi:MAG: tRNA (adenosine(37)-N6)-dimethylallyltransferase MiaA [Candidatus Cloacimonetes bacterium]|nr:tRNA (adenosine(37)-N6)-dimethylallyltransferase MiaA [Candidatus Cloacimonadota bacterium]
MQEKFLIIMQGPTGVGKSSLAEALSLKFNGEIISADSRQVYRYLDIGTAKPDSETRDRIKYHLLDIVSPDEDYNAGQFRLDALECLNDIWGRGKIPFVVGGTGFYISALVNGLAAIPPISSETRKQVSTLIEHSSPTEIYSFLRQVDAEAAAGIEMNDLHRQQRALEVFTETGTPLSAFWKAGQNKFEYNYLNILFTRDRIKLYDRINRRVDLMLEAGLTEEIKWLLNNGYKESDPGLNSVGYREFFPWLKNEVSLAETVEKVKQHSRNYAKRQLTWYRKQEFHLTIDLDSLNLYHVQEKIEEYWRK